MTPLPRLARILVYPFKSFDPVSLEQARVLKSGSLEFDRRFALVDPDGNLVTAKRVSQVQAIRCRFDLSTRTVFLERGQRQFHLNQDRSALEGEFSDQLSMPVKLVENAETGFPDDLEASGPTIVSTATLATVAEWFGLSLEETRRRFRANLEIEGVEPFWEDRLVADVGAEVAFQIGEASFVGAQPCPRCAVPGRDSNTGDVTAGFARLFAERREQSLPDWACRARFDHYYRLATNTRAQPGSLRIGEVVQILH